jgi:uncharacterized RDD family membrane protein YckC
MRIVVLAILMALAASPSRAQWQPTDTASVERAFVTSGLELAEVQGRQVVRTHQWVVHQINDGFSVLHRHSDDEAGALYHAFDGRGRVMAVAAHGGRLYCAYSRGSVQAVEFHAPPPPQPPIFRTIQLPGLPPEAALLDLAAGPGGPLVLVRLADAANLSAGSTRLALLRHAGLAWEEHPLPQDIDQYQPQKVLALDDGTAGLILVTGQTGQPGIQVHRWSPAGWTSQRYNGISPRPQAQQFVIVPHSGVSNLVVVQPRPDSADRQLQVVWLRGDAPSVVGQLAIDPKSRWWSSLAEGGVALLTTTDNQEYRSTRIAFPSGEVADWAVLARARSQRPVRIDALTIIVIAAMVLGTLILLMSGRRSAEVLVPNLPVDVQPAGLSRVAAAAVDFAPGLAVSMIYFTLHDPTEVLARLPLGRPIDTDEIMPALLAIAVHVAHTTLTELFTGSTLGKAICGCRIITMNGSRPNPAQVLIRNATKVLEMVVPFLLIFAVLSPTYQRLGDLLARTLVVTHGRPPQEPEDENQPPR